MYGSSTEGVKDTEEEDDPKKKNRYYFQETSLCGKCVKKIVKVLYNIYL